MGSKPAGRRVRRYARHLLALARKIQNLHHFIHLHVCDARDEVSNVLFKSTSFPECAPSFAMTVQQIFLIRTKTQMIWVYAIWLVAVV